MATSWIEAITRSSPWTRGVLDAAQKQGAAEISDWLLSPKGVAIAGGLALGGGALWYGGGRTQAKAPVESGITQGAIAGASAGGLGMTAALLKRKGISFAAQRALFSGGQTKEALKLIGHGIISPNKGKILGSTLGLGAAGGVGGYYYGKSIERGGIGKYAPAALAGGYVGGSAMAGYLSMGRRGAIASAALRIPGATAAMIGFYGYNKLPSNKKRL